MNTVARLENDLLSARKTNEKIKVQTLQAALTRITNAQAAPPTPGVTSSTGVGSTEAPRLELTDIQVKEIIQQEIQELEDALVGMRAFPNHPYTAELKQKIAVLTLYVQ